MQALVDQVGDRGLARPGQAGEPQHLRHLALDPRARGLVHVQVLPVHVVGPAQGEVQGAGGDGVVALPVDQDEAAQRVVLRVGHEGHRLLQAEIAVTDLVELQALGGQVLLGVHVDPVLDLADAGGHGARADLQPVGPARQQGRVAHPQHMRGELVGHRRWIAGRGDHVATADVDLVGQGQGHRLAGEGACDLAVRAQHPGHGGAARRRQHHHRIARRHLAGGNRAGETAEVLVGPVDPLHRQAQAAGRFAAVHLHRLQVLQQRRPGVPGRVRRSLEQVVALQRRQRDCLHLADAQLRGQRAIALRDRLEHRLVVADQVHLVHRQHHLAQAQQRDDVTVPAGLRQQALARIHQHHGQVGGGGSGGHVAGVLLVAGAVGDDELALVGVEVAVGHVDGDALLALGGQAIQQQGIVDPLALGAVAAAVGLQRGQLVIEQAPALVQQAPDQGALAIVHAAAGDEAQQRLVLVRLEAGGDVGGSRIHGGAHQK